MGEDNDGAWESEEFRCHACTANAAQAGELAKSGSKHPEALRFAARRVDPKEVTIWRKPRGPSPSS
jgi:hypothetical protein